MFIISTDAYTELMNGRSASGYTIYQDDYIRIVHLRTSKYREANVEAVHVYLFDLDIEYYDVATEHCPKTLVKQAENMGCQLLTKYYLGQILTYMISHPNCLNEYVKYVYNHGFKNGQKHKLEEIQKVLGINND